MTPRGWGLYLSPKHQLWAQSRWPGHMWAMAGRQRHASKRVVWLTERRGRERTKTGNNHGAIGCWTHSERWLTWAPHAMTKELEEMLKQLQPLGLWGDRERQRTGRERAYPSPFHSGKREAGSITLPVSANGYCRDGERGWLASTSSSRCSLGCCWFNKYCLVFDWFPFSEVTCFLFQLWPLLTSLSVYYLLF